MKDNLLYITNVADLFYFGLYSIVLLSLAFYLSKNRRLLFWGLAFNALIRILSVFFHYYLGHVPFLGLGFPDSQEDAIFFFKGAKNINIDFIITKNFEIFTDGVLLYQVVLKSVLLITQSEHILVLALFNSILSLITVYNCFKISSIIWKDYKTGITTVFILGCLPVFITYSIITLREAIAAFFFSWSMLNLVYYHENRHIKSLLLAILFLIFGGLFHGGMMVAIPLVLLCVVFYLVKFKDKKIKQIVRISIALFGVLGIVFLWRAGLGADKLAKLSSKEDQREFVKGRIEVLDLRGNSDLDYGNFVEIYSVSDLFRAGPYLYVNFLFRPKPLEYLADVFRLPGSWVMYLGTLFIFVYYKEFIIPLNKRILIIVLFGTWFAFSLGCFNVGQADRHRMKLLPVFVCIMAKPISDFRIKRFLNWKT